MTRPLSDRDRHPAIHAQCMEVRVRDMGLQIERRRNGRYTECRAAYIELFDPQLDGKVLGPLCARVSVPTRRWSARKWQRLLRENLDLVLAEWKRQRFGW